MFLFYLYYIYDASHFQGHAFVFTKVVLLMFWHILLYLFICFFGVFVNCNIIFFIYLKPFLLCIFEYNVCEKNVKMTLLCKSKNVNFGDLDARPNVRSSHKKNISHENVTKYLACKLNL